MRPARRRSSPPFFGAATGGLRGGAPAPGRRAGRASSSSSPARRAGAQPQRFARRGAAAGRCGGWAGARRGCSAVRASGRAGGRGGGLGRGGLGGGGGFGGLARLFVGLAAAPPPLPCGGPPLRRPCALPPRGGGLPRPPTGWRSSPARAVRPHAARLRAAARPARAGGRPVRSGSAPRVGALLAAPALAEPRAGAPPPWAGACRSRRCGALLAHLHLDDFGPSVTEALPYRAGIHSTPQFQPSCRTQRKPAALAGILIVGSAHALSVGTRRFVPSGSVLPCSCQSGQPLRFNAQRLGQLPGCDCHMHHIVTPEHPA